jgi:phage anti-repressor protein
MKELIKITEQDGRQAVSARELHAFLGSKQNFADWIKSRIKQYGLIENEDYVSLHKIMKRAVGGSTRIEYALSVDCAKELAMVEGNEQGKRARRYFIVAEKALREAQKIRLLSMEEVIRAENTLREQQKAALLSMKQRIERLEASHGSAEPDGMTIYGFANMQRKRVYGSEAISLGKRAVKLCKERGEEIGRVKDVRFGWVNVYPEDVLAEVFEDFFKNTRF